MTLSIYLNGKNVFWHADVCWRVKAKSIGLLELIHDQVADKSLSLAAINKVMSDLQFDDEHEK